MNKKHRLEEGYLKELDSRTQMLMDYTKSYLQNSNSLKEKQFITTCLSMGKMENCTIEV